MSRPPSCFTIESCSHSFEISSAAQPSNVVLRIWQVRWVVAEANPDVARRLPLTSTRIKKRSIELGNRSSRFMLEWRIVKLLKLSRFDSYVCIQGRTQQAGRFLF